MTHDRFKVRLQANRGSKMRFSSIMASVSVAFACFFFAVDVRAQDVPPETAEQRTLVVLPLAASGVEESVARSLDDLLVLEIERAGLFAVVARRDLEAILSQVELKQLLGVEEDGELAKVGERLQADYLLRGQIGKVGATYLLTLTLLDVKQATAVRRVQQTLTGDADGLVGSLHAAVVALALEEEGVAPSLTAELIEGMTIARKPKTFFLRLGLGWEAPVGPTFNDSSLAYLTPNMATVNVSAAWQALPWLQLVGESGIGFSIAESLSMQNKRIFVRKPTNADSAALWNLETQVSTTDLDFSALRVPLLAMVRFQPPEGRLLPWAMTGIGVSWQRYSIGDERIQLLDDSKYTGDDAYPCLAPYAPQNKDGKTYCVYEAKLRPGRVSIDANEVDFSPSSTVSYLNLQFPLAAGVDYLISQHFGVGIEARYTLTYALTKNARELTVDFHRELEPYDRDQITYTHGGDTYTAAGGETREIVMDAVPIRRLHHGIAVAVGVFYYY
ncbi:MAG: hypothetical protein C4523_12495 [Myxococcales bacterium]|nr:MAG: hypothetical protein C4523_12495 [Myxococcales bacterium]